MNEIEIRRAKEGDIGDIARLLYEVHKVHSDLRPDLFKAGAKKYTDKELERIISDDKTPVFVAQKNDEIVGYVFCIHQRFVSSNNMTDIKTLYIDDLCVDKAMRGKHIGKMLYDYVVKYAKENEFYNITLNVWADNKSAFEFYKKIGLKIQKIGMEKIL